MPPIPLQTLYAKHPRSHPTSSAAALPRHLKRSDGTAGRSWARDQGTSTQQAPKQPLTASSRLIRWCPQSDSNRHCADFKSAASANWAMGASQLRGYLRPFQPILASRVSQSLRSAADRLAQRIGHTTQIVVEQVAVTVERHRGGVRQLPVLLYCRRFPNPEQPAVPHSSNQRRPEEVADQAASISDAKSSCHG